MPDNPALLLSAELDACAHDKARMFERHYLIKDKDGKQRMMAPLKVAQRKTLAVLKYCRDKHIPPRIIIAKSRKQGETSLIRADQLDEVLRKSIDAMVIAHDRSTAEYIFQITKRFYDNYDLPKPPLYKGQSNKREMRFENHDGRIEVETANNIQAGTGRTPQYLHCSEVPKWEKGAQTLGSLLQAVGDGPDTTIVLEATFFGSEPAFLPMWTAAYENSKLELFPLADGTYEASFEVTNPEGWNGYIPLFISVLDDEDARQVFVSEDERRQFEQTVDDYEQVMISIHHASLEYLKWRRFTIKNKCQGDISLYKQEYPATPEEAIRASGRPRLNRSALDLMPIEDGRLGRLYESDRWDAKVLFKPDVGENLTVFRTPMKDHRYVIGVDSSEGRVSDEAPEREKSDASCVIVLDLDNGNEQVATYYGRVSEDFLVDPLRLMAVWYNTAYVVIETNSTGKHVAIEMAKVYPQDRLYHSMDWIRGHPHMSRSIGWRTHVGTRNILISGLADAIHERAVILHDRRTLKECVTFIYKDSGRVEADTGHHDDHCFALGLAIQGIKAYPVTVEPFRRTDATTLRMKKKAPKTANAVTGY